MAGGASVNVPTRNTCPSPESLPHAVSVAASKPAASTARSLERMSFSLKIPNIGRHSRHGGTAVSPRSTVWTGPRAVGHTSELVQQPLRPEYRRARLLAAALQLPVRCDDVHVRVGLPRVLPHGVHDRVIAVTVRADDPDVVAVADAAGLALDDHHQLRERHVERG